MNFFPVYSYLIVYRPEAKPLQIVSILDGRRDVEQILKGDCDGCGNGGTTHPSQRRETMGTR